MELMVIKRKTLKLSWKTIIIFQNSDTWKIELIIPINIISSKNTKEEGVKDVLNMISFANAQCTLKIGLAGSKV